MRNPRQRALSANTQALSTVPEREPRIVRAENDARSRLNPETLRRRSATDPSALARRGYFERDETAKLPTLERLRRLITGRQYRSNFAEPESWRKDPGPIHGPSRIEAISPSASEEVSLPELQRRVQGRLTSPEFKPIADTDQRGRLRHKVAKAARQCFYLNLDLR
jgi:hypothetical protein